MNAVGFSTQSLPTTSHRRRPSCRWVKPLLLGAVLGAGLPASPLMAQVSWANTGGGIFSSGPNWLGGVPPTNTQTAYFALPYNYVVTFATSPTTAGLQVTNGTVYFQTDGFARTYASGDTAVHGGNLVLYGGVAPMFLATSNTRVYGGSTLTVQQGNDLSSSTYIDVGNDTTGGTLIVTGSGSTAVANAGGSSYLANGANYKGTINVLSGGSATYVNGLNAASGAGAIATVNVSTGGTLTLGSSTLATNTLGGTANVNVTYASAASQGTLTLSGGSTVTLGAASGSSATLALDGTLNANGAGLQVNKTGTINASSTATFNGNSDILLNGGAFNLASTAFSLTSGHTLTAQAGGDLNVTAGYYVPSAASATTITGTGSSFVTSTGSYVRIVNGSSLNVLAGATATLGSYLEVGTGGNGQVLIDGAGSSLSASAAGLTNHWIGWFGSSGALTVQNSGSLTLNRTLIVGVSASVANSAMFDTNATASLSSLAIAQNATAATQTMTIQGGADVTASGSIDVADSATAGNGSLLLNGSGSTLSHTGTALTIGSASGGTGLVQLINGAVLSTAGTTTINKTGALTFSGTSAFVPSGNITVNGGLLQHLAPGPTGGFLLAANKTVTVTNNGTMDLAGYYGFPSASTLNVTAGGVFNEHQNLSFAQGSFSIDGTGSKLISAGMTDLIPVAAGATNLAFHNSASGTLGGLRSGSGTASSTANVTIDTGADVTSSGPVSFGYQPTAGQVTTVLVTGTGSTLTADSLSLGTTGGSTATLSVTASGALSIGPTTSTIWKTGSLNFTGGSLNLNGNLTVDAGKLTGGQIGGSTSHALTFQNSAIGSFSDFGVPDSTTVTATGAGTQLNATGIMYIGNNDQLLVNAGAHVTAGNLNAGTSGTGTATITISDASSSITTATCYIGLYGETASMTLQNSATGSLGTLHVADSSYDNSAGTLLIQSGATASADAIAVGISGQAGQSGSITVSGPGSSLAQSAGHELTLGAASNSPGQLVVSNAGSFAQGTNALNTLVPAQLGNATNTTILNPTGSISVSGGSAALGAVVRNGGSISFSSGELGFVGDLVIGSGGLLGYPLTLSSNRSLALSGNTYVAMGTSLSLSGGSLSTGTLTMDGTFNFNSGILALTNTAFTVGPTGLLGSTLSLSSGKSLLLSSTATIAASSLLYLDGGTFSALGGITNNGEIQLDSPLAQLDGGTLTNNKLLWGNGRVDNPLSNAAAGEVRVPSGDRIVFTNSAANTNAGKLTLFDGTLEFAGPLTNSSTGIVTGRGQLIASAITNTGQLQFSTGNSDVFGSVTNNSPGKIFVTGGGSTTFHNSVTLNTGSELRVDQNSSAVFFAPLVGVGNVTGIGFKYFEAGASEPGFLATSGYTTVASAASLSVAYLREASLDNYGAVTIKPAAAGGNTSVLQAMMLHGGSSMDLADNKLVWDYTGSSATPLDSMRSWIHDSLLNSSTAAADPQHRMGLAYGDNALLGKTTWGGQSVDPTSILVKLSWLGDANLDGKINADDYALLDLAAARHVANPHWTDGDFNSDGLLNSADYLLIDRSMALQSGVLDPGLLATREAQFGPAYVAALVASVPEPGVAGVLLAGAAGVLARRRRSN